MEDVTLIKMPSRDEASLGLKTSLYKKKRELVVAGVVVVGTKVTVVVIVGQLGWVA